jgi:sialidase-1
MPTRYLSVILLSGALANCVGPQGTARAESAPAELRKVKDLVIYRQKRFYAAFPSIVTRPSGELIVAFRRAPEHAFVQDGRGSHTDPNSYLVLVRSVDNAATWTTEPELIYAHPWGGSQDPCMVQLRDGTIVCSSYAWYLQRNKAFVDPPGIARSGDFIFMGGYLMRSADGGRSWDGPIVPPPVPGCKTRTIFGELCPAYNRGAMCQGKDGRLYWAVAARGNTAPFRTEIHLMVSEDRGRTWEYRCPIARDAHVTFNETSLVETPSGQLVAFIRTADFKDHTTMARSKDGGRSFQPWEDAGFQGHPHYALRLPDHRVLLVYGYRHEPYGIRARVLDPECRDVATAKEIVLRDDGGTGDLGYPWATVMADGRILVVYYFNKNNGVRHIAGTILAIKQGQ